MWDLDGFSCGEGYLFCCGIPSGTCIEPPAVLASDVMVLVPVDDFVFPFPLALRGVFNFSCLACCLTCWCRPKTWSSIKAQHVCLASCWKFTDNSCRFVASTSVHKDKKSRCGRLRFTAAARSCRILVYWGSSHVSSNSFSLSRSFLCLEALLICGAVSPFSSCTSGSWLMLAVEVLGLDLGVFLAGDDCTGLCEEKYVCYNICATRTIQLGVENRFMVLLDTYIDTLHMHIHYMYITCIILFFANYICAYVSIFFTKC